MSWFNNKNKTLKLYILSKGDNLDNFLCVALSKKDIVEYLNKLLKFEHLPHYQAWCSIHEYDAESNVAWKEYFDTCIDFPEKSRYKIANVTYKLNDVVAIMRMFGGCIPIGCSFETQSEHAYMKYQRELESVLEEKFDGFKSR